MWLAGYNIPGYLPDAEPVESADWHEARDHLLWVLDSMADEGDDEDADLYSKFTFHLLAMKPNNKIGWNVGKYHWFIDKIEYL